MKAPMAPGYYDQLFTRVDDYRAHYRDSRYYVLWTQVISLLRQVPSPRILEIGCGPGQFAHYLHDEGFRDYHGFDFSPEAVRRAREVVPQAHFEVGDALAEESYRGEYNVAVVLEVLEHVSDDLGVLDRLRDGAVVLFSLPTFDDEAHLRHFRSPQEIVQRYQSRVDFRTIVPIHAWFVCLGLVRGASAAPKTCDSFDLLGRAQAKLMGIPLQDPDRRVP
jgi:2-polyprenyl-3-methyl-5-hydroxy-6-metoxy-1,4-benzoquinol methylase